MSKVVEVRKAFKVKPKFVPLDEAAEFYEGRGGARSGRKVDLSEQDGSTDYEDEHPEH